MLRVTLEMVPFGVEAGKRTLGVMEIANVGGGLAFGDYTVALRDESGAHVGSARVTRYTRRAGAWTLVRKAIKAVKA
jgi:hypothetical protein